MALTTLLAPSNCHRSASWEKTPVASYRFAFGSLWLLTGVAIPLALYPTYPRHRLRDDVLGIHSFSGGVYQDPQHFKRIRSMLNRCTISSTSVSMTETSRSCCATSFRVHSPTDAQS